MKNNTEAQIHALDRVLYLLEERSISRLAEQDDHFKEYIRQLYDELHNKTMQLQR